nr:transglutaminase domain-containing protein [Streptomyces albus]
MVAEVFAPETLREAVDRVLRVPDEHRTFTKDAAFAEETWAIGPALLEALMDHGLPHRGEGGRRRFERTDLHNISTYLRLPSPYFLALARKARAMEEAARAGRPHVHELELRAGCASGHPGACSFAPVPGLVRHSEPGSLRGTGPGAFSVRARLPSDRLVFDEERSELLSLVADWELYVLPDGVIEDEGFSRATRLANCLIPTRLLLREAERRGIGARHGAGLLVAPPFTTPHHWVEFELDGGWVPADPVLLTAFARWGMTDPAAWPYNRSVAGIVWHLLTWPSKVFFPVVHDHGRQAPPHISAR